jgi:hypothetical protein
MFVGGSKNEYVNT